MVFHYHFLFAQSKCSHSQSEAFWWRPVVLFLPSPVHACCVPSSPRVIISSRCWLEFWQIVASNRPKKKKKKKAKCLSARSARVGCEAELKSWWAQRTFSRSFASPPTETSNIQFDNCFWCNVPPHIPRGDLIFWKQRKAFFFFFFLKAFLFCLRHQTS